jgi:hypothetical protein
VAVPLRARTLSNPERRTDHRTHIGEKRDEFYRDPSDKTAFLVWVRAVHDLLQEAIGMMVLTEKQDVSDIEDMALSWEIAFPGRDL